MRKIESQMNRAIRNKVAWSSGNTCTTFDSTIENCFVYLHGNHIATYNYDNKPDRKQSGYVSEWTDFEGVNLQELFHIHRRLVTEKVYKLTEVV